MRTFKTKDDQLKIEFLDSGEVGFIACAGRINFSSRRDLMNITIDIDNDMFYIEFDNSASITIHFSDFEEAKDVSDFLHLNYL